MSDPVEAEGLGKYGKYIIIVIYSYALSYSVLQANTEESSVHLFFFNFFFSEIESAHLEFIITIELNGFLELIRSSAD